MDKTVYLLRTCAAFGRRRKRHHLGLDYINDLDKASYVDIGSLNCFIECSDWFQDYGRIRNSGITIGPVCSLRLSAHDFIGGTATSIYLKHRFWSKVIESTSL